MSEAAAALLSARTKGGLVAPGVLAGIDTLEQAYAVQRSQLELSGETLAGWKIGATSAAAQGVLGLDGAVFGPVSAATVHESGARVVLRPEQGNFVECEFVLRLATDLPPRSAVYTRAEVAVAVASMHAGFELVGCRLQAGLAGAGPLVVADYGVNGGAVLGGEIPRAAWDDLAALPVVLTVDGAEVARGAGRSTGWAHVLDAVAWLATRQGDMARPLKAGDLVMTGTCTGVVPIRPGQLLQAGFGDLAQVSVTLA